MMRRLAIALLLAGCGGSHDAPPTHPLAPPADAGVAAIAADAAPVEAVVPDAPHSGNYQDDLGTWNTGPEAPAPPSAGRVVVGIPSGTSSLDPEVIRRIMRARRGLMLRCYKLQRDRDPRAAGAVAVHLEFGPDGKVTTATASGVATELEDCLGKALGLLQFPAAVGTSKLDISLTFSPP